MKTTQNMQAMKTETTTTPSGNLANKLMIGCVAAAIITVDVMAFVCAI